MTTDPSLQDLPDEPQSRENGRGLREEPDRRTFLRSAGAAGAAVVAGLGTAACRSDSAGAPSDAAPAESTADSADPAAATVAASSSDAGVSAAADSTPTDAPAARASSVVPFRVAQQAGVAGVVRAAGTLAVFDVLVAGDALAGLFRELSEEIERLMNAAPADDESEVRPPFDSGLLGPVPEPSGLAIVVGVGASLFDDRFGLADRKPTELWPMPLFRNDGLMDRDRVHGDLAFTITADSPQAVTHALQQLVRISERKLALRWTQSGYNDIVTEPAPETAPTRNLLGFKDGTANPDTADAAVLDEHVWIDAAAEPAWAAGGTYQAVRVIRMFIEFWSTVALVRQELIIGRDKETGAPLGQGQEQDEPAFVADSANIDVPPASHMRRANPRTGQARLLRRGFSYINGADSAGLLDQGLLFYCFQRSLVEGFVATQNRLDGEPLEDYIKPVGGGFFFVLPGPGDGPDGWLGQSLLAKPAP